MALGMSHPLLNSLTFFLAVTLLQLALSFVMLFVKFKMFTIIPFFLIPMLIMQMLTGCLLISLRRKLPDHSPNTAL